MTISVTRIGHPIIRRIYTEIKLRNLTLEDVAKRSGVSRGTLWEWRKRAVGRLTDVEAVMGAVGLVLVVVEAPPSTTKDTGEDG